MTYSTTNPLHTGEAINYRFAAHSLHLLFLLMVSISLTAFVLFLESGDGVDETRFFLPRPFAVVIDAATSLPFGLPSMRQLARR